MPHSQPTALQQTVCKFHLDPQYHIFHRGSTILGDSTLWINPAGRNQLVACDRVDKCLSKMVAIGNHCVALYYVPWGIYSVFVLLWFGKFLISVLNQVMWFIYPYSPRLLHRYWDNYAIALYSKSVGNKQQYSTTKYGQVAYFCDIWYIAFYFYNAQLIITLDHLSSAYLTVHILSMYVITYRRWYKVIEIK